MRTVEEEAEEDVERGMRDGEAFADILDSDRYGEDLVEVLRLAFAAAWNYKNPDPIVMDKLSTAMDKIRDRLEEARREELTALERRGLRRQ